MKNILKFTNDYNTLIFIGSIVIIVILLIAGRNMTPDNVTEDDTIENRTTSTECKCEETKCTNTSNSSISNISYSFTYTKGDTTIKYNVVKEDGRYTITNEKEAYYILYSNVYKLIGKDFVLYRANIIDDIDNNIFVYDYLIDMNNENNDCSTFDDYIICYKDNLIKITGDVYDIVIDNFGNIS